MSSRATPQGRTGSSDARTPSQLFAALADSRRRRIAASVRGRPDGLTVDELTTFVASAETGVSLTDVTEARYERVLVSLRHHHLPKFEEIGLLYRQDARIVPTDPAVFEDGLIDAVLGVEAPPAELDAALELLASERRRILIDRLRAEGTASVEELAAAVAEARGEDSRNVHVSLVHTHLPRLDDEGVISEVTEEAPSGERRVRFEGLPAGGELFARLARLEDDLLPHVST
ncbi:DUF7344 domain-containing protein [Halorientalis halophila]|uniref:DUF7344 domain-containing protein n=1 Tax=Halorientalis halophila TaxID=3108499 RepID=UPI00300B439F